MYVVRDVPYTKNLIPGNSVYGEKLVSINGKEFRYWDPTRSKLSAAIMCGLKTFPFKDEMKVLYLGAASGTTLSHISDIVGKNGLIYAVEFSERVIRKLFRLSHIRKNIVPIFADARKINEYYWVENVDIVYVDIADPQEIEISIRNAKEFLKSKGYLLIAVKSQSIDVSKDPEAIYNDAISKLKKSGFIIKELINIDKYEKKHSFIVASLQ